MDYASDLNDCSASLLICSSDFAEAYPDTAVIGTDLSPIQPDTRPPNLNFEIDDCCSDWVYPNDHFDYIHIRQLYGSVADWPKFYRQCYEYDCSVSTLGFSPPLTYGP